MDLNHRLKLCWLQLGSVLHLLLIRYAFVNSCSRRYVFPFSVFNSNTRVPYLTLHVLPNLDKIFTSFSFPSCQSISTSNPPLATKPLIRPFCQALGSAGSKCISPAWL